MFPCLESDRYPYIHHSDGVTWNLEHLHTSVSLGLVLLKALLIENVSKMNTSGFALTLQLRQQQHSTYNMN